MGTNFYLIGASDDRDRMNPEVHVGKRSAAGMYCWDCKTTLCMGGNRGVHDSNSPWFDVCPICGKGKNEESLDRSAAGRELGFNKSEPKKKTGVYTCCSFSWAMSPEVMCNLPVDGKVIEDEYGDTYTLMEFQRVLEECPIRYYDSIDSWFC
jgi:hypothetical protein